uniref:Uncharacterized protein At2g38930 n=1 Tax=Arabidopsis thaliana TaxID=3702 RepID=Q9ZV13_ARATH|nr:unknown protein [Arabidopsis thaliana]
MTVLIHFNSVLVHRQLQRSFHFLLPLSQHFPLKIRKLKILPLSFYTLLTILKHFIRSDPT